MTDANTGVSNNPTFIAKADLKWQIRKVYDDGKVDIKFVVVFLLQLV